jgi:orotate phosphoribosyltransferase-like protein
MKIDTNKLKEIILEELCLDIDSDSRIKPLIDAKVIYCKILRNCGWTLSKIGESINRDHASMIHYLKRFENEVGQNENADIMINYKKVSSSFNRYLNKNYLSIMTRSELEQTIEKLLKDEKYI